jgi:predicted 2-oxoglutarate/Fe(II)-dependent dioxygenase YbiX
VCVCVSRESVLIYYTSTTVHSESDSISRKKIPRFAWVPQTLGSGKRDVLLFSEDHSLDPLTRKPMLHDFIPAMIKERKLNVINASKQQKMAGPGDGPGSMVQ